MPKKFNILTNDFFNADKSVVLCKDTLKLELGSVAILSGASSIGKSYLALKICANALNEGFVPFFWSLEDKIASIKTRIKDIEYFYPFESEKLNFSNERPNIISSDPNEKFKK
ncbi:helicase RepA family protein [Campylobacter helveticus]|uniref:helicase RepA family protein n=1 Tax=Campylobacter helveticus TaxID=28898 RepID=UPI0009D878D2|nr:helicase RepA family protein [Campylobacter helveticus]MCR2040335.1 helicase RepA family protein [Campylobacter helveticus]MCR2055370.1 helicase RepA family protein [Campylobacter helveticus]MCR2062905.1 helicase RepA family protein [Campylobacter helveticus]MCR2066909.1 helicase RepA family protein [Campylobacter helveticus]SMC23966.1 hypothetical protein SAMN02745125_01779 [Campylobacter helveticus]